MRVVGVNGNTTITFDDPATSNQFGIISPVYAIGIFIHPHPMIILHCSGLHIDITEPRDSGGI
jgi:hypothetical protein